MAEAIRRWHIECTSGNTDRTFDTRLTERGLNAKLNSQHKFVKLVTVNNQTVMVPIETIVMVSSVEESA